MSAPLPPDEPARLAALHGLGILDTLPEPGFDDIVLLARELTGMPTALISFVDEERQWFKARSGLNPTETPRAVAFCAHAILGREVMIVPDAAADPRFAGSPLVTGPPHIRFYAGAPMLSGGHALGTVCVIDSVPHPDFAKAPALAALARQAAAMAELRAAAGARGVLAGERGRLLAAATHDLDQLWRMAHELMIVTDLDARLLAVNPAWEALFGVLPADGSARPMDWHHDDEDGRLRLPLRSGVPERFRRRYIDRDGGDRFVTWTLTRNGDRMFGVGRDDSALIAAEDNLRHGQKMEAVGRLTGGIAHDFNNLLTIVIGNLDIATRRLGEGGDPRVGRALAQAGQGAQRAATLTQRLLAFARRQPLAPRAIDPARQLGTVGPLIERVLGDTIRLEIGSEGECWVVLADPSQLESALLNLAVNARDAMAGGDGRLTVTTANVTLGLAEMRRHALPQADFVRFSVADTGSGMAAEIADRVFEPFFTTKAAGHGTGLGLSQVHGFATQSEGFVTIDSAPGVGTTVHLWLPRAVGEAAAEVPSAAMPAAAAAGGGTSILVVEDNDAVREMLVTTLRDDGYRVIEAHDGNAGLVLFERQDPAPDIVISDVQMPNLDGPAMIRAMRAGRPDTRVLLITGFAEAAAEVGGLPLLLKPFTRHALLARVAALTAGVAA